MSIARLDPTGLTPIPGSAHQTIAEVDAVLVLP